jgi:hypothetical protein
MIGVLGFDCRRGLGIFLFTTASRTALEPTQPPIQWVPGAISLGVKRPGREADHLPPSSAEVKSTWSYTSTPQYAFMAWSLVKHRDNLTFTFMTLSVNSYLMFLNLPRASLINFVNKNIVLFYGLYILCGHLATEPDREDGRKESGNRVVIL